MGRAKGQTSIHIFVCHCLGLWLWWGKNAKFFSRIFLLILGAAWTFHWRCRLCQKRQVFTGQNWFKLINTLSILSFPENWNQSSVEHSRGPLEWLGFCWPLPFTLPRLWNPLSGLLPLGLTRNHYRAIFWTCGGLSGPCDVCTRRKGLCNDGEKDGVENLNLGLKRGWCQAVCESTGTENL